jgi:hypothetical protein
MNESVVYYKYQSGSSTYTTLDDTELETQLDVPYCVVNLVVGLATQYVKGATGGGDDLGRGSLLARISMSGVM